MTISAAQIRGARAMLKMTQEELAAKANLSQRSLAMIETEGARPRSATVERLRTALEEAGAVFIATDAGLGVLIEEHQR